MNFNRDFKDLENPYEYKNKDTIIDFVIMAAIGGSFSALLWIWITGGV